jgi:predicted branched-subunit amino acid permease
VIAWLTAPLLVAGASQLTLISQLDAGEAALAAVTSALLVNSRFVIYGAALARRFSDQPRWFRWLGPSFVVDQTYALAARRSDAFRSPEDFRRYYLAASTLLWATWTVSVGAGVLAGPVLPSSLPLEFVFPAMFVALVVPMLKGRSELFAAALGALVVFSGVLSGAGALLAPALAGAITGAAKRGDHR